MDSEDFDPIEDSETGFETEDLEFGPEAENSGEFNDFSEQDLAAEYESRLETEEQVVIEAETEFHENYSVTGSYSAETGTITVEGMELQGSDAAVAHIIEQFQNGQEGLVHEKSEIYGNILYESSYYIEGSSLRIETIATPLEEQAVAALEAEEEIDSDYDDTTEESTLSAVDTETNLETAAPGWFLTEQAHAGEATEAQNADTVLSEVSGEPDQSWTIFEQQPASEESMQTEAPEEFDFTSLLWTKVTETSAGEQILVSEKKAAPEGSGSPEPIGELDETETFKAAETPGLKKTIRHETARSAQPSNRVEVPAGRGQVEQNPEARHTQPETVAQKEAKIDEIQHGEHLEIVLETIPAEKENEEEADGQPAAVARKPAILLKKTASGGKAAPAPSVTKEKIHESVKVENETGAETITNKPAKEAEANDFPITVKVISGDKGREAAIIAKAGETTKQSKKIVKINVEASEKTTIDLEHPEPAGAGEYMPAEQLESVLKTMLVEQVGGRAVKLVENEAKSMGTGEAQETNLSDERQTEQHYAPTEKAEVTIESVDAATIEASRAAPEAAIESLEAEQEIPELQEVVQPQELNNAKQTETATPQKAELETAKPERAKIEPAKPALARERATQKERSPIRLRKLSNTAIARQRARIAAAQRAKRQEQYAPRKQNEQYAFQRQIRKVEYAGPRLERRGGISLRPLAASISSEERDRLEASNRIYRIPRNAVRRRIPASQRTAAIKIAV